MQFGRCSVGAVAVGAVAVGTVAVGAVDPVGAACSHPLR